MTENPQLSETTTSPAATTEPTRRTLRDRLPSGRKAVAAGAVVAGLAIGGAGFGAGYAVADAGSSDTATTQTTDGWGDRRMPGGGPGQMGGPMGEMPDGGQMGGTTGEAPDFDGDGSPDTDSGSGSTSSSSTLNS